MPTIEFGSRKAANDFRDRASEWLAADDSRRRKAVKLKRGAPAHVRRRGEEEAFTTRREGRSSSGMAELSEQERRTLERTQDTYSWQQHGFEAMRAKAALQQQGATDWMDFWEPGEGAEGAMKNLRRAKERSARTGAGIGVESRRTDEEELMGQQRRRRQGEAVMGEQLSGARRAAILEEDPDAMAFLEREREVADVFDLSFSTRGREPKPLGETGELVEDRHEMRSPTARAVDRAKEAPKTRDPLKWSQAPNQWDFPGVDTVDPDRAREQDDALFDL